MVMTSFHSEQSCLLIDQDAIDGLNVEIIMVVCPKVGHGKVETCDAKLALAMCGVGN